MDEDDTFESGFAQRADEIRWKMKIMFRAGIAMVVASFLYEVSFTLFGIANGASILDSILSQFSISGWNEFLTSKPGAGITAVYVTILAGGFFTIHRPEIWKRDK